MTTLVTSTGIHKSGNSWLAAMLNRLLNQRASTAQLTRYFCLHDVAAALGHGTMAKTDLPANSNKWAKRLLHPTPDNRLSQAELEQESVRHLSRRIRWNMARANQPGASSISEIADELRAISHGAAIEQSPESCAARFVTSKHVPLKSLRHRFPDFKTLWLVRDPRDVLVSHFYHDMGVLTSEKLDWFDVLPSQSPTTWQRKFLTDRIERLLDFYRRSLDYKHDGVLVIRYENLLNSCAEQLGKVWNFIPLDGNSERITEITEEFSFRTLTNSFQRIEGEKNSSNSACRANNRNSFVRKGVAGEWNDHFCINDRANFSAEFCDLLISLDYEPNDSWLDALPAKPARSFDLSCFRMRSSAIYNAMDYWLHDQQLQLEFPRPFDFSDNSSFFEHLKTSNNPTIAQWFERVNLIFGEVPTSDERSPADETLGY